MQEDSSELLGYRVLMVGAFCGGEERVCSDPECFEGKMKEHGHFGAIQT